MTNTKEQSMPADPTWKFGNEFAPYHPQASHCDPSYRDGWNHCYAAARERIEALEADARRYRWLRDESEWEPFDSRWLIEVDIYGTPSSEMDAAIDAALGNERAGGGEQG